ncbi:MAG: sugar ABC transporter permease [Clostridia bacterium]|nr:sugar ABC transporter permease [Clostridia bacterium]
MKVLKYIWRNRAAYLMIAPLMIGVLIFCYYPPIYGFWLAFTDKASVTEGSFVGFDNFKYIFTDPIFLRTFSTMLKIQIPRLISGVVVPLIYAELVFGLSSKKAQGIYRVFILLPTVAPGVVSTLLWKQIFQVDGLLNALFGLGEIDWLGDADYVIAAILIQGFPWIGGSQVLIYLAGIMNIPRDYFEAADLDGAGTFRKIFTIHIPLISGQVRYFLIFGIINGLQDYGTQVVLTQGGPYNTTNVPGYYMYKTMYEHDQYGIASAVGVVLFVIIMILTVITNKFVKFGDSADD